MTQANQHFQRPFTRDEIQAILDQDDLVLRNLQITLGYYRIAQGLRMVIGENNVNWFCFGCYASKTAGQALRHELFPSRLKSILIKAAGYESEADFYDSVLRIHTEETEEDDNVLAEILSEVSLLVSRGNYLIFSELAWPFSDFIRTFSDHSGPHQEKLVQFLDLHLDPRPVEVGGQAYLREAFSAFYSARFEPDPKKKAEWILLGNLMTGFHEQTRIQPVIESALASPFDRFSEKLLPEDEQPDTLIELTGKSLVNRTRPLVLRVLTEVWMTYALPAGELKLGDDVPVPPGSSAIPAELANLTNPRTLEITQKFDKNLRSLSGSAAGNWGSLDDRMTYLADFFRGYQRYTALFEAPFSDEQITAINAGQLPNGRL